MKVIQSSKKTPRKPVLWSIALLGLTLSFTGCSKDKGSNIDSETITGESVFAVGAEILSPAGSYLFETSNLTTGAISFLGNGANVTTQTPNFMSFIYGDGFYYAYINNTNTLSQYAYKNQKLELVKAIPFTLENSFRFGHCWVDANNLLIYSLSGDYKVVDVRSMTIHKQGKITAPAKAGFSAPYIGFMVVKDNKCYVSFGYPYLEKVASQKFPGKTNSLSGTANFAVYDYPAMDNVVYSEDSRSSWAGNERNGVLKTFVYNDDLYAITATIELSGGNWDKPTGLYRFKKGSKKLDEGYFLNISEKLNGDNTFGGAYAGNGKLVVRRIRQELVKEWANYGFANVQEYHVVDLATEKVTKLDIPLSKSLSTAPNVLADLTTNTVYFGVNTKDLDGNFNIYQYNSNSNTVKRGVKINNVDQVNVLLKVK
ncbi:hypothetical protein ACL9RF_04170 [Sphingobacterium sp. Mn56C]|uniref:hypothetical protein n=1 Tax=Sphingobacterium sp. Mn56C TaxID=3395261 RepID=UPI003BEE1CC5